MRIERKMGEERRMGVERRIEAKWKRPGGDSVRGRERDGGEDED